jgi:hypothetical protein
MQRPSAKLCVVCSRKYVRVAWLEARKKQIGSAPSNWRLLAEVNNQRAWNLRDDERVRLSVLYDSGRAQASANRNIGPTLDIGLNQPTVHPVRQAQAQNGRWRVASAACWHVPACDARRQNSAKCRADMATGRRVVCVISKLNEYRLVLQNVSHVPQAL